MKNGILKVFVCCHKYIYRVKEIKSRVDKWNLGDYLIFVGGEEENDDSPMRDEEEGRSCGAAAVYVLRASRIQAPRREQGGGR